MKMFRQNGLGGLDLLFSVFSPLFLFSSCLSNETVSISADSKPTLFSNAEQADLSSDPEITVSDGTDYNSINASTLNDGESTEVTYLMNADGDSTSSDTDTVLSPSNSPSPSSSPYAMVVSLGRGSLPLRTQHAIEDWNGSAAVVFTDENVIYVALENGTRYAVTSASSQNTSPTIAVGNNQMLVAWVTPTAIMASTSTNLTSWSTPVNIGTREQLGGPIPCATWNSNGFVVGWVDAPKTNVTTGAMDGIGKLQIATESSGSWSLNTINQTAAIVSVSQSKIVWRDDRNYPGSITDSIRIADTDGSNENVLFGGYDPAVWNAGSLIAIGYHKNNAAYIVTSSDSGTTWSEAVLDLNGKFVAPGISTDGSFTAVWVDYVDEAAANDARNDSGQRTTIWHDNQYYPVNSGATGTTQGQLGIVSGQPVIAYQVSGSVYLVR